MHDALKAVKPTETGPYPNVATFSKWIGITLAFSGQGEVCLQLRQRSELNDRPGMTHSGVLARLLDSAMARAARTLQGGELRGTVDLHVQFLQPAKGMLTATGWVVHTQPGILSRRGAQKGRYSGGYCHRDGAAAPRGLKFSEAYALCYLLQQQ